VAKREKKTKLATVDEGRRSASGVPSAGEQPRPPKKQPVMLAISVVLFALWFVFLLVTAVFGR
jgi:hypothetical protein